MESVLLPGTRIVGFGLSSQLYDARGAKSVLRTSRVDEPGVSSVREISHKRFAVFAIVVCGFWFLEIIDNLVGRKEITSCTRAYVCCLESWLSA